MARQNTVKVSDEELAALHEARQKIFGSDNVPFGEVIEELATGPDVYLDNAQSGGPKIDISYNDGRYYVGRVYPRKGETCGHDHEEYIYWSFGNTSPGSTEQLSDMPESDRIDLTKGPVERTSISKSENPDAQDYSTIPCGCGDFEVHAPSGTIIPSIDVVCPECGNHFGHGE